MDGKPVSPSCASPSNHCMRSQMSLTSRPSLIINFVLAVLWAPTVVIAQDTIEPGHRAAIERLLESTRAVAAIHHFAVPNALISAAVDRWGFDLWDIEVPDIEPFFDGKALDDRVVAIYAKYLTTDQALKAAEFFESLAGRRILTEALKAWLPSTDPLIRENLPPSTSADLRELEAFEKSHSGKHLKVVTPEINEKLSRAVEEAADLAVDQFVSAKGLPNRRLQQTPNGGAAEPKR